MAELVLGAATNARMQHFLRNPTHALLVVGERGLGVSTVAVHLAAQLAGPSVIHIEAEKGSIPIERIRQLYAQTRSRRESSLAVVIDDADTMSTDAQNALLKLLEEPPRNVHFLLAVHDSSALLSTIRSRAQALELSPVSPEQSRALLDTVAPKLLSDQQKQQILFLAQGLPAEIVRLAKDGEYLQKTVASMTDARQFVEKSTYDRLVLVARYSTDRDKALAFVDMIGRLTSRLMTAHTSGSATRLLLISDTLDALKANGNAKVQMMYLAWRF